jgi:hypothetical protein
MLEKRGPFWESPPEKEVHLGSGPVGYTFGRSDLGVYTSQIGHAGKRRSVLIVPWATSDLRAWTCFSRAAPLSRSDLFFRPPRSDLFLWGSPTFQIGPLFSTSEIGPVFVGQPDLPDRTCFLDQPGPPAWRHIWGRLDQPSKKRCRGRRSPEPNVCKPPSSETAQDPEPKRLCAQPFRLSPTLHKMG